MDCLRASLEDRSKYHDLHKLYDEEKSLAQNRIKLAQENDPAKRAKLENEAEELRQSIDRLRRQNGLRA